MSQRKLIITANLIARFTAFLRSEERAAGTVENYTRHVRQFAAYAAGAPVTKETASAWRTALLRAGKAPVTVNAMLVSVNRFFAWAGRTDCRVRTLRIQRRLFREETRELTAQDYQKLVAAAKNGGKERLVLLLETICATGIRVSEARYITVEAARAGKAEVALKGKLRTILLPGKLCRKLLAYAKKQKIASGEIFLTKGGKSWNRKQIWAAMKVLCAAAKVEPGKVFPHNLRHLFAREFYKKSRDVIALANVLGHASVETTRIYLISTAAAHLRLLDGLKLVL